MRDSDDEHVILLDHVDEAVGESREEETTHRAQSHAPHRQLSLGPFSDCERARLRLVEKLIAEPRDLRLVASGGIRGLLQGGIDELDAHRSALPQPRRDLTSDLVPGHRLRPSGIDLDEAPLHLFQPCRLDVLCRFQRFIEAGNDVARETGTVGPRQF